ncbi:hypothetical protein QEO77_gp61 [Arthrobacter phage Zaheer]|uniref:Uncharacterized protein n=1 Tax=Arthrobacter phage Zaheer TaxID=2836041 RepID=A0A8F3E8N6_9CAUD|nr:hypothetical protein QEO77_gp61 [Arthrobacter phage Zaheer]QWY84242.1 hypothetical protein SEA_ZAHEER_45 [Arthrobacter phage Zaheer]
MDAVPSQGCPDTDFPRNLYFGAEDWKARRPDISDNDLAVLRNKRHNLVGQVTQSAERLITAVSKSLRQFDATGNAGDTLDHIDAVREDLAKLTQNLVTDIEDAEERYTKYYGVDPTAIPPLAIVPTETPAAAVEPSPQQAPAAAGPKPHGGAFSSYKPREGEVCVQISSAPSPADVAARLSNLAARMPVR